MIWVIDASVAIKWFVQEEQREDALRFIDWREDLYAPDLIVTEVAGIAWKKCIRGEIGQDQARFIAASINQYIGTIHPSVDLIRQALDIALSLNHSIYDCLYLACAERFDGVVITADQRLSNHAKGTALESRVCTLADFDFDQLAHSLQISTEKIEEIIRLWELVDDTRKHVYDRLTDGKKLPVVNTAELAPLFNSPNWRNLRAVIDRLPENELADVVAIGWLGKSGANNWEVTRERAQLALLNRDGNFLSYVCSLAGYLERGLQVLESQR